jgi:hypothetical protein
MDIALNQGPDKKMKLSVIGTLLLGAAFAAFAQQAMPRMTAVEPVNGKIGDVIVVTGENLQKDVVAKVYLTDGKNDIEVAVSDQTEKELKFKIPAKATGRLSLMILTHAKDPKDQKLIEQPVKVQIDQ